MNIEQQIKEFLKQYESTQNLPIGFRFANVPVWLTHQASIISQQQRYIGFLQVCARTGERWEGSMEEFLKQGDKT